LAADGYSSRLTDYLNASERGLVALTDVVVASPHRAPESALDES